MIKLTFTITQLNEFYKYLVECVISIKYTIAYTKDFYQVRKLNAELSEFNNCLLKVQTKVTKAQVLGKIQKNTPLVLVTCKAFYYQMIMN